MRLIALVLVALVSVEVWLGLDLRHAQPKLDILPPVPRDEFLNAAAFGDRQFLFRVYALQLQNAGDTGGRFTPMREYAIPNILEWLRVLQRLDPKSDYYPFLAVRYFSQTPDLAGLRALTAFIDEDVPLAPERKWFWQTQAVEIAKHRLEDISYALELSKKLYGYRHLIPTQYLWALQIEPSILLELGRVDDARRAMDRVMRDQASRLTAEQRGWAEDFYRELEAATDFQPQP